VSSPITPTIVVLLIAFCIGVFIMSLLGTAADAILVLFCIDEDTNDNNPENNPQELNEFLTEHDNHFKGKWEKANNWWNNFELFISYIFMNQNWIN